MISKERITAIATELEPYTIEKRREIHRYGEISGTEVKTSSMIAAEAGKLGLPVEKLKNTGLIVTLDTGRPGVHVALRADIDALPMKEHPENLKGARQVVSDNPNTCHACGHDAHTAMLLTAMKGLASIKDEFNGVVYFCFEEGEENGGGIQAMLDALETKQVDTIWGIHVYAVMPSGTISVDAGPCMAGGAGVDITVKGRGGHGSRTDLANNPVFAAAAIVNNLGTVFANQIDADETVTLGITRINGGEISNIIPDTCYIGGSMRFFNLEEGAKAVEVLKKVATNCADMYDCTVEFGPSTRVFGSPTTNDDTKAALAQEVLNEVLPAGTVIHQKKWYGSESMGRYLAKYPGVFAFLGINNPEKGTGADHHNEHFDVDEDVLRIGVISTMAYALAHLSS